MDRRSVSPRAAARALCLSGSSIGFLLSFAFEYRSYFPDAFLCCVFQVVVCPARDWYQRPCLRDEAVYLFLYGDDELSTVGGLEGVCRLYFLCVAGVVFGVKQSVDRVRAHDVRVGQCVIIVIGGIDGWWGVFAVHDCA